MDPSEYKGFEWTNLMREMSPRPLKNAMKAGYRRVAKKVAEVGRKNLRLSGLKVQGSLRDWGKGIRTYVYSKGGGFLMTVMPRRGKRELSYHENRRYGKTITRGIRKGVTNKRKLPILLFAEDGTNSRQSGGTISYVVTGHAKLHARHGEAYKVRRKKVRSGGHNTGSMKAYHFLEKSEPEAVRIVENDLSKDLDVAVTKAAIKAGMI